MDGNVKYHFKKVNEILATIRVNDCNNTQRPSTSNEPTKSVLNERNDVSMRDLTRMTGLAACVALYFEVVLR